ncbi:hypothetical protein OG203_14045 [Nocardia sp. NBC_01499]|uniref:hypothetical protein n=1 Tax=Nocardia sp. NBC_01499 TaxID=2903597 RepID=UPI003864A0A1
MRRKPGPSWTTSNWPPTGFVDVRDIAEVAELTAGRPVGGEIELSGPRELHLSEVAAALGRPVRYLDVPLDEHWRARFTEAGASSSRSMVWRVCTGTTGRSEHLDSATACAGCST